MHLHAKAPRLELFAQKRHETLPKRGLFGKAKAKHRKPYYEILKQTQVNQHGLSGL